MPPVALIASAAAFAAAEVGTIAALSAGIGMVGSALGTIGMISGNKTLSKIGAVVGIIGGGVAAANLISSAASAATSAGSTAAELGGEGSMLSGAMPEANLAMTEAAGTVTPAAGTVTPNAGSVATENLNNLGGDGSLISGAMPENLASPPTQLAPADNFNVADAYANQANPASPTAQTFAQPQTPTVGNQVPQTTAPASVQTAPSVGTEATTGIQATGRTQATQTFTPADPWGAGMAAGEGSMAAQAGGSGAFQTAGQWLKQLTDYAKTNPVAAQMLFQGVQGMMDMASGKTGAQVDYYKALSKQANFNVDLQKQRIDNLNNGYKNVNTVIPTNPNAPVGLIYNQIQRT